MIVEYCVRSETLLIISYSTDSTDYDSSSYYIKPQSVVMEEMAYVKYF